MISIRQLTKTYRTPSGESPALRGIDLQIGDGELLAVVGRSGSGKSTLLNLLGGIDTPSCGSVRIDGTELQTLRGAKLSSWRGLNVGFVFQFFQLLPTLTALENVMLPMDFARKLTAREREGRGRALLDRMGIADQSDKLPSTLSGGQQQRVAIARALANDPPLLLADEPTGNLDSQTSADILHLFDELAASGKTVVLVTHAAEAAKIATRTVTLADGRIAP